MKRLLWIGDAACDTGFARATHKTLEAICKSWDVSVLGINYDGDPHTYPYNIYRAARSGDWSGIKRLPELLPKIKPDIIVVQNDPWHFPHYLKVLANYKVIGAVAVDGKNCRGRVLNGLASAVFWTEFGLQEARLGGYTGPAKVIPLGVDLSIYKPIDKTLARKIIGIPSSLENCFLVGNVNRNQPRKRLDLTISYFAEWVKSRNVSDAYLLLHVAPTGEDCFNCEQLAGYYGIGNRVLISDPGVFFGLSEERLSAMYSVFDAMISTTQGEGMGLTTLEGMACGIPQILPDWSALGEWAREAALMVPCTSMAATLNGINVIGGIPDRAMFIQQLDRLYRDKQLQIKMREEGLSLAYKREYSWEVIGEEFLKVVNEVADGPVTIYKPEEVEVNA